MKPAAKTPREVELKSWAYWYSLGQVLIVLLPLAVLVMNGPSDSGAMLLGGTAALFFLWGSGVKPHYPFLGGIILGIGLYALLALARWDDVDTYRGHYAIFSLYYGLPVGLLFRQLARNGRGITVVVGFACLSLGLAVASYKAVQTAGLENIISYSGTGVSRLNIAGDQATYWRFFYITNVIVGVVPYTIFALCGLPLLFIPRTWAVKLLYVAAMGMGTYVNILVVTRTPFLAAGVVFVVLLVLQVRAHHRAIRPGIMTMLGAGVLLLLASLWAVEHYAFAFRSLLDRFALSLQDGRLVIWSEAIGLIPQYPWGGAIRHLTAAKWGHNLLLDAGLTTGIPGMLAILATLCCLGVRGLKWAFAGRLFVTAVDVCVVAVAGGALIVSMLMPPQVSMMCVILMLAGYIGERVESAPQQRGPAPEDNAAASGLPVRRHRGLARVR